MPQQLVTVEGNIGSGKTTCARAVANYMPDCRFFPAPGRSKNPHWPAFHERPEAHALAMQSWFLRERLKVYASALRHMRRTGESAVLDFALWSDEIYATVHREHGFMTDAEFDEYQELSRRILALGLPPPHLTIVLHADAATCLERVSGLERPSFDETLLRRLDALHRQRYLRDLPTVITPKHLAAERVSLATPGLTPAPSLQTLVRNWSDLSKVRPTAIADAVLCTEPVDFAAWIAPFEAEGVSARMDALLAPLQTVLQTSQTASAP